MHICQDEIAAVCAASPFVAYAVMRVKHAWHWLRRHPRPVHVDGCCQYDHPKKP